MENQENKKKSRFNWKKTLYFSLLTVFASVFLFSGIYIIRYAVQSHQASSEYDDLLKILESQRASLPSQPSTETSQPNGDGPVNDNQTGEPKMLPEYALFYAANNDFVGWINIPDTKVNYPVLQSSLENRDYYLKHTFKHQWSDWGAIYVREECDVFAPSDNLTIYGHHMKDGEMFTGLDKFKNRSFWESHKTFTFDTLYEYHTYEIFAAFRTSGTAGVGYPYHLFVSTADQQEYDQFVASIKAMSLYDTGITPQFGEKLICLSTCEYTQNNGRLVVVARRIS